MSTSQWGRHTADRVHVPLVMSITLLKLSREAPAFSVLHPPKSLYDFGNA
jgi:hypothetical protein